MTEIQSIIEAYRSAATEITVGDRRRTPVVPNLVGNFKRRGNQCVSGSKQQGNRRKADVLAHVRTL